MAKLARVETQTAYPLPSSSETPYPPLETRPAGRIGRLRVLDELGRGGMGIVYRARDPELHRDLAVKVMHLYLAVEPMARDRFLREARAAATVEHPNVVPVYEVGELQGLPYLVMPLLHGRTLAEWCRGRPPRPPRRWLRIGVAIADGLAAIHRVGLVHRDIKPSNVWLETGEHGRTVQRVRLLDFGLARSIGELSELTDTGQVIGTYGFMAPEQLAGTTIDHRADLFSLGCILYELATGMRPFAGTSASEIAQRTTREHPPAPADVNPEIPQGLSNYILSLLAKDPEDRPPTAMVVRDTLWDIDEALRRGTPLCQPVPSRGRKLWRWILSAAAVAAAFALGRLTA